MSSTSPSHREWKDGIPRSLVPLKSLKARPQPYSHVSAGSYQAANRLFMRIYANPNISSYLSALGRMSLPNIGPFSPSRIIQSLPQASCPGLVQVAPQRPTAGTVQLFGHVERRAYIQRVEWRLCFTPLLHLGSSPQDPPPGVDRPQTAMAFFLLSFSAAPDRPIDVRLAASSLVTRSCPLTSCMPSPFRRGTAINTCFAYDLGRSQHFLV